jgi:uncharacterized protein YbaP (TraB family)
VLGPSAISGKCPLKFCLSKIFLCRAFFVASFLFYGLTNADPARADGTLLVNAAASQIGAAPAMWRIADDDSEVWIFGSVHVLPPDLKWHRPELASAMDQAEFVYFEAPTDLFSQVKLQAFVAEHGFFPRGRTLSDSLSVGAAVKLQEVVRSIGGSMTTYERMRPWLAFTVLSLQLMVADGADPSEGVDAQLTLAAAKAEKQLRYFETLEQQTNFFASMALADQIAILEAALHESHRSSQMTQALISAWISGDLAALEASMQDSVNDFPADFKKDIFLNRNIAWAKELDDFLHGSGNALVIVGAGHMVGDGNLLELLEQRGWTIERM